LFLDIVGLAQLALTFKFFVGCMLMLMGEAIKKDRQETNSSSYT
jgi:hypothetical protein